MASVDTARLQELGLTGTQTVKDTGIAVPGQKSQKLGQEEFMSLMLAQLKNQDPFKPLSSGEFLGQIAQFAQVSGIQDLQGSFTSVADSLYSNQALQASALVGRQVLSRGSVGVLDAATPMSGAVTLPESTSELVLEFSDSRGQLVSRVDLGIQQAGTVPFSWKGEGAPGGTALPGAYQVRARARIGGQLQELDTMLASRVESVSVGGQGQGVTLNLATGQTLGLSQVREIR